MGSRLPQVRREKLVDSAAADWAENLTRALASGVADGVVTADFQTAASTSLQLVPHGLERAYRGAFVVAQSGVPVVRVLLPSQSPDATKQVAIAQSAGIAQTIRLVVF